MHGKLKRFLHYLFMSFFTAVIRCSKTIFNVNLSICNHFCHTRVYRGRVAHLLNWEPWSISCCGHEFLSPAPQWLWGLSSLLPVIYHGLFPLSDLEASHPWQYTYYLHSDLAHWQLFFLISMLLMCHSWENACHLLNKIGRGWSLLDTWFPCAVFAPWHCKYSE